MPSLLAHVGAQGIATRLFFRGASARWICLGALIPDLPWIFQRVVRQGLPLVDPYELGLHVIVQASYVFCLLLCGSVALCTRASARTFGVLSLGSLLHLLLDAAQTKWGSGVHLLAPLSWRDWNLGLFWPESVPTVLLTAGGLAWLGWIFAREAEPWRPRWPSPRRAIVATMLFALYAVGPIWLRDGPLSADSHYLRTLQQVDARPGRELEVDRNLARPMKRGAELETFAGERLYVPGLSIQQRTLVSLKGVFLDRHTIEVREVHIHPRHLRNLASYFGLALVGLLFIRDLAAGRSLEGRS